MKISQYMPEEDADNGEEELEELDSWEVEEGVDNS